MNPTQAWQEALSQEQQAVYGFGLVGGRLGPSSELAREALTQHRERMQQCQAMLSDLGADASPGAPAFDPVVPVISDQRARALATELERNCAAAYSSLTALTDLASRRIGTQWLRSSAVDQFRWSGRLPALPGLDG